MNRLILPLLLLFGTATAQQPPRALGQPASIPFVDHDGIYDFAADGDHAIYLQDRNRTWYHGTVMGPCLALPSATRIGVKTSGGSSLDKFGSIIVDGEECHLSDLVTSAPPPRRVKKPKAAQ